MNKLLASSVSVINGLLAFAIVLVAVILGGKTAGPGGAIVFGLIGLVIAIVVCGLLALIVDMRNELMAIRRLLEDVGSRDSGDDERREPTFEARTK